MFQGEVRRIFSWLSLLVVSLGNHSHKQLLFGYVIMEMRRGGIDRRFCFSNLNGTCM